jgi:hypothetical protein
VHCIAFRCSSLYWIWFWFWLSSEIRSFFESVLLSILVFSLDLDLVSVTVLDFDFGILVRFLFVLNYA